MKVASKFYGTCQICGRQQKLPGGGLSLHGYQVAKYGFFVGTCMGANALPYEKSCDLLKVVKAGQEEALIYDQKNLEAIKDITDESSLFTFTFYSKEKDRYHRTQKIECIAHVVEVQHEGYVTRDAVPVKADEASFVKAHPVYCSTLDFLNSVQESKRRVIINRMKSREEWIKDAALRIADWKVRPLTPINSEEDATKRELNKFEKSIIAEVNKNKTVTYNDHYRYAVRCTVTYNRVKKLARDGFLKLVGEGANREGYWITVTLP